MKATGMVRNTDNMGRIVIPKELRKTMQIEDGTPLELFVMEDTIVLKKYNSGTSREELMELLDNAEKEVNELCIELGEEKVGEIIKRIEGIRVLLQCQEHY